MTTTSEPAQGQGQLHLLFIRHGETQDNIDRVLQGHRDTSLTDKGHRETQVLVDKLAGQEIDVFYHSPLTRIVQTIAPLLHSHPDAPVHADSGLKGQALGELEGGSYDSIDMDNPRSADGGPGVERFNDFVQRLKRVFGRIVGAEAPRVTQGHGNGKDRVVAIATHGVCITSIFKALENTPDCDGLNPKMAVRGPEAYEVRWTDSDDVARMVVKEPARLPVKEDVLDWEGITGEPFLIEVWGKKEKAVKPKV